MKYILTLLTVLFSFPSTAQNTYFLQAKGGWGITGTAGNIIYTNNLDIVWANPIAKIPTFNAAFLFGMQHNKWIFSGGISYLQTGYKEHYEYFEFWNTEVENNERFYHVVFPVTVSRKYNINDRLFFNPGLGLAYSYNYAINESGRQNDRNNVFHTYNDNISKTMFDFNFLRHSLWSTAQTTFGYSLNKQMDITIGPEMQIMLTPIDKSTGAYTGDHQNMRNYALLLNAGVIWHFKKV